jgi:hypothetical protein
MIEFEVRHGITNREADIGTEKLGSGSQGPNVIGNIFYGSEGYLAIGDEDTANAYQAWLGSEMKAGPTGHEGGSHYHFANFMLGREQNETARGNKMRLRCRPPQEGRNPPPAGPGFEEAGA